MPSHMPPVPPASRNKKGPKRDPQKGRKTGSR